jgi:hypothetical protein
VGAGADWVVGAGLLVEGVVGVDWVVDGAAAVVVVDFFFVFLAALCFTWSAGTVPPTSTPATAGGAATLMVSAFTPAPAVAVFDPPELAIANAAANAATTATRPMAIERVSMRGLYFLARRARCDSVR